MFTSVNVERVFLQLKHVGINKTQLHRKKITNVYNNKF